jgi:tetratricopeptide (TPR) repeat protein
MEDKTRSAAAQAAEFLLQGDRAFRPEHGELVAQVLATARQRIADPQLVILGARILIRQGSLKQAARLLVDGIRTTPEVVGLHALLGSVFKATGDRVQAERAWRRTLALDGGNRPALLELALLCSESDRREEGWALLQRGRDFADEAPEYWEQVGDFLRESGALPAADSALCRALVLRQPGLAVRMAHVALARGDWRRGWLLWRARHYLPSGRKPPAGLRGTFRDMSRLGRQAMLIRADADAGDQLLLTRFVAAFLGRWEKSNTAQTLWLQGAPRLTPLLQHMFPAARVIPVGQALPAELAAPHATAPMFDLPVLLEANEVPSLVRAPALPEPVLARWKARIGSRPVLRCGVAWSAEIGLPEQLTALIATSPEIEWHAFVSGAAERPLVASGLPVVNWAALLPDALEDLGLLSHLDGVVTSDPAMAFLAGLVGKPAWLLSGEKSNWRWREPWCPDLRVVEPDMAPAALAAQIRQRLGAGLAATRAVSSSQGKNAGPADVFSLLTEFPTDARSHQRLFTFAQKAGDPAKLLPWLRRAAANSQLALILAQLLVRLKRANEAVDWFVPVIRAIPGDLRVLLLASDVARTAGKADLARQWAEMALALDADNAQAQLYLGNALREQGNLADARAALERACALDANYAAAFNNLGVVCREIGDSAAAIVAYERALEIDPRGDSVRANRGNALRDVGRFAESLACYEQLIGEQASDPELYYGLGNTYKEAGEFGKSIDAYRQGLKLAPEHHDLQVNLSLQLLLDGQLAEGWDMYEARFVRPKRPVPSRPFAQPRWNGESLKGRSLLVWGEQGAGDKIMLARLVREAARQAGEVIVETNARLLRLMQRSIPEATWVAEASSPDEITGKADFQTPICSLGRFFRRDVADFVDQGAFLVADQAGRERWLSALADLAGYRVGLVWAGNPEHQNDHNRSLKLADLTPLFEVPGVSFVSLQIGKESAQIAESGLPIKDMTSEIKDYADTADLVSCLDLVISVDTSVAHLAGALGVPTWVLIPFCPDWRWMTDFPHTTPWYASLRLYRQSGWRDWRAELLNVERDLRRVSNIDGRSTLE